MDQFGRTCRLGNLHAGSGNSRAAYAANEWRNSAADLYLSPSTVRNHLAAIYKKLSVHSQTQLLAKLLRAPD